MNAVFSIVGLLVVGKVVLSTLFDIIVGIKAHFLSRIFKTDLVKTYGKWAVVTGCTDGIGKSYMNELARRGMNIVLISRNLTKLEKCAKEVESQHGVKTEIVQANFIDGKPIYDKIEQTLKGKEIGILVNNVGTMLSKPKKFLKATEEEIWGHVNVNIASIPAMTKLVLPSMVQRKQGAIVNVASAAAIGPIPYMGIYSASKSFVDYFSNATSDEYRSSGVFIQTLTPSYVATNMTSFHDFVGKKSLFVPDADTYARHAVNTIGHTSHSTGFWPFGIQAWTTQFMTRSLFMFSMKSLNLFMSSGDSHKD